jgi:protein-tyrosine-phosphatase
MADEAARERPVVLFLCSGNSARSQMAERLLRRLAGDRFAAHSAGVAPRTIHPLTHRVLAEIGIDTSRFRSKDLRDRGIRVNAAQEVSCRTRPDSRANQ